MSTSSIGFCSKYGFIAWWEEIYGRPVTSVMEWSFGFNFAKCSQSWWFDEVWRCLVQAPARARPQPADEWLCGAICAGFKDCTLLQVIMRPDSKIWLCIGSYADHRNSRKQPYQHIYSLICSHAIFNWGNIWPCLINYKVIMIFFSLSQKELPQHVLFLLPFVFFGNILFWRRKCAVSCRSVGLLTLTFNMVFVTVGPMQKDRLTDLL